MTPYWDPFDEIRRMQDEIDRAFDGFFGRRYGRPGQPLLTTDDKKDGERQLATREPLLDIVDEKEHLKVQIELPGVKKDDIEVEVRDNTLTIKAEVKEEQKKEDKGYFYQERRYQAFNRSIRLPAEVDPDKTDATYTNGILEVVLKKKKPAEAPKEVKVKIK